MSLEEFKNIEDLYKAKTFGTTQHGFQTEIYIVQKVHKDKKHGV